MNVRIEFLDENSEMSYEQLMLSTESTLLYSSIKYRNFLRHVLGNSKAHYLLAYEGGELIGALPAFVQFNQVYGNLLNSLPFYGSNGGIVISPECKNARAVSTALLNAFHELALQYRVATSTLITNPLDSSGLYQTELPHTWRDERIGQQTRLPNSWTDDDDLQSRLMGLFHPKTRNHIRKATKSNVLISHSDSLGIIEKLAAVHKENIEAIGGQAKPWPVFAAIRGSFDYNQDFRIYVAERNGEFIAALLVFFYNQTAEYFTPGTCAHARVYQPMSLLIFEAMKDAAKRGLSNWNWGGTWVGQSGVYDFKKRWGTSDIKYYYYVREYSEHPPSLRDFSIEQIHNAFPYFYALPYRVLEHGSNKHGKLYCR